MTNKLYIAGILLAVLLLVGCAEVPILMPTPPAPPEETSSSSSLKTIDFRTMSVMPFLTADLNVDANKAVGTATGTVANRANVEREALANALKSANRGQLDGNIADLIVEPTYFYEQRGRNITITAIGYPARYRNFRTIDKPEWIDASQTAQPVTPPAPTRTQTVTPTPPVQPTTVTPIRLW